MVMESCLCTMYGGTQVIVYIYNNNIGQSLHCTLDWLVNCDTFVIKPTNYIPTCFRYFKGN